MFIEVMASGRESSGAAGSKLIPTRFVWPHGGRSVYLCGSFTGWAGQYPMTPVEGCPTVFQITCSLPLGYHQYKFVVDGEWRHDELQPFVSGNYGTVNTVLLAGGSDSVPALLSPRMHSNSKMDVDNEAFQCSIRVSDITEHEAFPSVSAADLKVWRLHIAGYLSNHMAYELLPESGKVIALDIDLPIKQALHILHEQGICMAPLWDSCKGQFVGVLSALDFILIIRELASRSSNLTEEELEMHTISAWKKIKLCWHRQMLGQKRV